MKIKSFRRRSLKRDIDCLIKLYTAGQSVVDPEEVIQSPINKVAFLSEKKGVVYKKSPNSLNEVGMTALYYTLLDYCVRNEVNAVSVEEVIKENGLWGKVFNMNRNLTIQALHLLTNHEQHPIVFTRTNNLDTIKVPEVNPITFLQDEYSRKVNVHS